MNRTASLAAACALASACLLSSPGTLRGQECPDGRISYVFIDNHSVFDTGEIQEGDRFRWAYELANSLHMTTREEFLRKELLFRTGECYDPVLLEESERLLRNYRFIARVDVFGLRQPDGSWHVVVDTKDEWTTKVELSVAFDAGLDFRGASISEENLLGQGYLAALFYRRHEEDEELGGRLYTPRIFGTRLNATVEAGTTRNGSFLHQNFFYPFVGEVGRLAFRQSFTRRDDIFRYIAGSSHGFDHALLHLEESLAEVTLAGRLGRPGNLTVFGMGFSNETLEFPDFPSGVELGEGGDFDDTEPAPPAITEQVLPHTLHSGATRVNMLFGQRNIRFVQREGLDALQGVQDVEVGLEMALTVGRSVSALSAGTDQPDDLFTRLRLFGGAAPGPFTGNLSLGVEGRRISSGGEQGAGWHDVIGELDALLYWQPSFLDGHTLFGRVTGAGGWDMTLPFQLTLGGPESVRGFHRERFPGARRIVGTVEDRIYVPWPFPDLADFGFTLFADLGRMWAGDVPFGEDSGWKGSVGAGLRIGFPAGTRGVVRIDVAQPIRTVWSIDDTIVRISLADLLGLVAGLEDAQLRRSRRVNVGPDLFTRRR